MAAAQLQKLVVALSRDLRPGEIALILRNCEAHTGVPEP